MRGIANFNILNTGAVLGQMQQPMALPLEKKLKLDPKLRQNGLSSSKLERGSGYPRI